MAKNQDKAQLIAAWKAKSAREVELPSGTKVTVRLTTVNDEIKAGAFSGPVLEFAKKLKSEGLKSVADESDPENDKVWSDFQIAMIAACVSKVEGVPVELEPEDVTELPRDDFDELFLYVWRVKHLPKVKG